jgi:hypothetical protein
MTIIERTIGFQDSPLSASMPKEYMVVIIRVIYFSPISMIDGRVSMEIAIPR